MDAQTAPDTDSIKSRQALLKKKFKKQYQELKIPIRITSVAWELWTSILESHEDFENEADSWLACLLFITATELRFPYGPSDPQAQIGSLNAYFTVTQLLNTTNMSMVEFFKKLKILREERPSVEQVQDTIVSLERLFCLDSALYHKLDKIFPEIFKDDSFDNVEQHMLVPVDRFRENASGRIEQTEISIDRYSDKKEICWCLFLIVREKTLKNISELSTLFNLLLCSIDHVLRNTPSFQLNQPYDSIRRESCENYDPHCILKEVCEQYHANFEEVKTLYQTIWEPCLLTLPVAHGSINYSVLSAVYTRLYTADGGFDEMMFLDPNNKQLFSSTSQHNKGNGLNHDNTETSDNAPNTPVRAVLNTVQYLRMTLASAGDQPSQKLLDYFKNCPNNPYVYGDVKDRLNILQDTFGKEFSIVTNGAAAKAQAILGKQRFKLAVRLYYRVLETLLTQEKEANRLTDFECLLTNAIFHSSLIACATEVVMCTYGSPAQTLGLIGELVSTGFNFPWVLHVFNLAAYDFYKIIESFIKAEPKLTSGVVRHLQQVENKILESYAWKSGSPLFDHMKFSKDNQEQIKSEIVSQISESEDPLIKSEAADVCVAPDADRSLFVKTTHKNPLSLHIFLNKACSLGYQRLQALCTSLDLQKDVEMKIWTVFEHCIVSEPELLKNRHIDQIMMCSIYAVCKVIEEEQRFKNIVAKYQETPRVKDDPKMEQVYKEVWISEDHDDSIITFYNTVFMQVTKSYILQFANTVALELRPNLSPVPTPRRISYLFSQSPVYRVPGHDNVYVSPMKKPPSSTQSASPSKMTPISRQLYNFGDDILGSSAKLKTINEIMKAAQDKEDCKRKQEKNTPRTQKRLMFDRHEETM